MIKDGVKIGSRVKLIKSNIVSNIGVCGTVVKSGNPNYYGLCVRMDESIWVCDTECCAWSGDRMILEKRHVAIYEPDRFDLIDNASPIVLVFKK